MPDNAVVKQCLQPGRGI